MARLDFENPRSYTKFRIIDAVRRKSGASVFIEAGTYRGATTHRCSSNFKQVYTVELDPELAEQAARLFAGRANVEVIHGDAMAVIPSLLGDGRVENTLIFLDGHFSGGVTACGDLAEPAVEELRVLAKFKDKICAIIVDDFRSFGTESNFPAKHELLKTAEDYFPAPEFNITILLDQLIISRRYQQAPAQRDGRHSMGQSE